MPDPSYIKCESEAFMLSKGGRICDWLPTIGSEEIKIRSSADVARRALVLNILVNLSFNAPVGVATDWLSSNDLLEALSPQESAILSNAQPLDEHSRDKLRWNIESLWAAAWVGGFVNELDPIQPISAQLAGFFPSLKAKESADAFHARFHLRSQDVVHRKLDLFYRAHWYARDCQVNKQSSEPFNLGVIQYRRLFLEWVLNRDTEWDNVDLST